MMNFTANNRSFLFDTDVYKLGHMNQYPSDVKGVYSVLQLRSDKRFKKVPVVGLQYFLKQYLSKPIMMNDVESLIEETKMLGVYHIDMETKLKALCELGYLPIKVKSIREGSIVNTPTAICTVENTHDDFAWVVGFIETLLLKWFSMLSTASVSYQYRMFVEEMFAKTSENDFLMDFTVHDFGSRGCMSSEASALTGMGHLLNFLGSDTVVALPYLRKFYNAEGMVAMSVPATEHSVMCSFGRENEQLAFEHMLDTYPTGIVSIVSDTYNFYEAIDTIALNLKDKILARDGKVVFRPDSGNPKDIILGDGTDDTCKGIGALRSLERIFGSTINSKGYKVLNSKVGLIYGDGMYLERYQDIVKTMVEQGWSAENLVIGVGGILRDFTRDDLAVAFKGTAIRKDDGMWIPIMKDPITDKSKKSYKGRISVIDKEVVEEQIDNTDDELVTVFENGKLLVDYTWTDVKTRFNSQK